MAASYSHTARIDGETLTAAKYNADHQNHIDNMIPGTIDDHSTDLAAMKVTTDPYDSGSASLATDLGGELARLRYMIKQITGQTEWYIDASSNLLSIGESRTQNYVLNGAMEVLQTPISGTDASSGDQMTDMFVVNYTTAAATGKVNWSRSTTVPGVSDGFTDATLNYSLKLDVNTQSGAAAADDFLVIRHAIEGFDYAKIASQAVTLSFWVRTDTTGEYSVVLGSGGSDRTYGFQYTVASADTWQKVSVPLSLVTGSAAGTWTTTNTVGLRILWSLQAGSNLNDVGHEAWVSTGEQGTSGQSDWWNVAGADFYLAAVKLEVGSTATAFTTSTPNFASERAAVQRYYTNIGPGIIGSGYATSTTNIRINVSVPTGLKKSPTVSTSTGAYGNFSLQIAGAAAALTPTNITAASFSSGAVTLNFTVAGATADDLYTCYLATDSLILDAGL